VTHVVEANDGHNHLHGGTRGFHAAVWDARTYEHVEGPGLELRLVSPDGDGGYPGTLDVTVRYWLATDALVVDYRATTDRATPVNLTQHTYFNLAGHDAGDVSDHVLTLYASRYTPVDEHLIPTGELAPVRDTPLDFTAPRAIRERIDDDHAQLAFGGGYDHNFVLDADAPAGEGGLRLAAQLVEPRSGRMLTVLTTEPGIHVYSGNGVDDGPPGKGGRDYVRRGGIALETQHFPDSPNRPHFPSTILRPGDTYTSRTVYHFAMRYPEE
jgi:aldose 1-epimerase